MTIALRITAPHFVAGIELEHDIVTKAAPIIGYMRKQKWPEASVRDYCRAKGWTIEELPE